MAERGAERGMEWLGRVVGTVMTTGAAALLAVSAGGSGADRDREERLALTPEDEDYNPLTDDEEESGLPPVVARAFTALGPRANPVHERTEELYAAYRLLKVIGLSDVDIAKLAARKAGERLDEGLETVRPTEARPLFDALEQTVVRAASEVDVRLNLGGDLIRPLREALTVARTGREEALTGLDRGFSLGREALRRALKSDADETV